MNEKKYLGEDKELLARIKENDKSIKVFFDPKLYIYHKERDIKKFLIQRMVFGTDLFNIIKFGNKINSFQPILPLFVFSFFFVLFFTHSNLGLYLGIFFFLIVQILIYLNVKKYLKKYKKLFLTIILINLANISYAIGSIFALLNLKNLVSRKFYIRSRQNK